MSLLDLVLYLQSEKHFVAIRGTHLDCGVAPMDMFRLDLLIIDHLSQFLQFLSVQWR